MLKDEKKVSVIIFSEVKNHLFVTLRLDGTLALLSLSNSSTISDEIYATIY